MKKKILFGLASGVMALSLATGCGDKPLTPDPVDDYVPDLSKSVTLSISNNYDKSTGMKYTQDTDYTTPAGTVIKKGAFKPVYQKLQETLNFVIDDVTSSSVKAVDQFSNDWMTNQYADIASGNVSKITEYSVSGTSETILDISEYLDYLPNFKKFIQENAIVSETIYTEKWGDQNDVGIYYFPYFDGINDLEKMTLLRADYVRKLLDADLSDSDYDTNASIWTTNEYTPSVEDDSYSVTVPVSLESNETKVITKAAGVTNIIAQQNALSAADRTGKVMVQQLRKYIDDKYGDQFAKRSDLFLGVDSCYDADEMIALMRVVRVSPKLLTGSETVEMVPFVPREYNNQRIADMYRWAGQLWGVRGLESRSGYLYIDSNGKLQDARGSEKTVKVLENLNALYKEGLILKDFETAAGYGVTNGKFAEAIVVGGNANYSGFMEYDYSQTQGVWNDKAGSQAIEGYDFRPVLGAVSKLDAESVDGYVHFTESWRSVKSQGWCLNASLKNDNDKLMRALALCDYLYSDEGQQLNSFGPEDEGYTSGTFNYQGREVAKFTDEALAQLNNADIGGGSYTNYLRKFVGATLPVGYVKEQGMEYQCTSENAKNGLAIINKAIELGTYKHVELKHTEDPFFTIVPSTFAVSRGSVAVKQMLEDKTKLGAIHSESKTDNYNMWDKYVMNGFGSVDPETLTQEQYLKLINETYSLEVLVKIYQDAYDYMVA
ncbi:MAG: hypothetical protein ACI311_05825 [Bacilli bacterium]